MSHPALRVPFALLATLGLALPVLAQDCAPADVETLTAADVERLGDLSASRLRGLGAAMTAPSADDRQTVSAVYGQGLAGAGDIGTQDYTCRTIKMGGISPLVVYQGFACAITSGPDGLVIDKPAGSQRFSGTLSRSGERYVYSGALYYSDEAPIAYGADPERDQVGCLSRLAADSETLVLDLPSPQFESFHDVIVLEPVNP